MKTSRCLLAAGLLVASVAFAEESAPPAETPAPLSRFSLGVHLSYWNAHNLDDFDDLLGGGMVAQYRLHSLLALEMRLSGYAAGQYADVYSPSQGWSENDTTITSVPFEAGLVAFLPVGDKFSLYGGPGIGYYYFDGEFRSEQGPVTYIYDLDLDDEVGFYGLLGARFQVARNIALFLEGKYTWIETSGKSAGRAQPCPEGCPAAGLQPDLDFSGIAFQAGMLFTF